jgi:hypothetical protein
VRRVCGCGTRLFGIEHHNPELVPPRLRISARHSIA